MNHEGKFYKFTDVTIEPRPAKGSLDIWIGGKSDLAIKRTARYGDGWFPSFVTPEEFKDGMAKLAEYGTQYGRTINPREAGVLISDEAGFPLRTPLNLDAEVSWVGYANEHIRACMEPLLQKALRHRGLLARSLSGIE